MEILHYHLLRIGMGELTYHFDYYLGIIYTHAHPGQALHSLMTQLYCSYLLI